MIPNMKEMFCTLTRAASVAVAAGVLMGCASSGVKNPSGVGVTEMRPDERGFVAGTGAESTDIVTVTDLIAREILSVPQIANAATPPRVVLEPVENNTRFAINKDMFLDRIRGLLNRSARGKVMFLARNNMAALERERQMKQSGQVTATSDPNVQEFKGADYFLTGKLNSHTTRTSAGVSDYMMYSFQLVDARTTDILYENFHEVKKQGLEDAAYR
jgi:PBP1b-binding outer membrane lipoprotein LpoB